MTEKKDPDGYEVPDYGLASQEESERYIPTLERIVMGFIAALIVGAVMWGVIDWVVGG